MMIAMGLIICTPILALVWLCLELALGKPPKVQFLLMIVFVIPAGSLITQLSASVLMGEPFRAQAFGELNSFFIGLALTTTLALSWVRWLGFRLVKRTGNQPNGMEWDGWDQWDG